MKKIESPKINPRVKDILKLIGAGLVISTVLLVPGAAYPIGFVAKEYEKYKQSQEEKILGRYKMWRVRQITERLEKQKVIKIDGERVVITEKGRKRLLQYDLQELRLNEQPDGKWRIIIYDVAELNKREREAFRAILKRLKFLQVQKSVYITPFPCGDEIEYIRQRFNIGSDVKMIVATGLENAEAYKAFFGL